MATTDFEERLAALEVKQLALADLPLAALQRKLENDWQPDGAVLIQPHSITSDQLAVGAALLLAAAGTDRKVNFGSGSYVFPGGGGLGAFSTGIVTHGLGAVPVAALLTNSNTFGDTDARLTVVSTTSTQITVQGRATVAVGAGGAFPFYWLAIA